MIQDGLNFSIKYNTCMSDDLLQKNAGHTFSYLTLCIIDRHRRATCRKCFVVALSVSLDLVCLAINMWSMWFLVTATLALPIQFLLARIASSRLTLRRHQATSWLCVIKSKAHIIKALLCLDRAARSRCLVRKTYVRALSGNGKKPRIIKQPFIYPLRCTVLIR